MKKLLLLSTIILQTLIANAQKFEWLSHSLQGTSTFFSGYAPVAVDPAGNVYTAILAPSSGVIIQGDTIHSINGDNGMVVAKFGPSGNFIWGKMFNNYYQETEKIAVDNAGAVYVSTYMQGTIVTNDTTYSTPNFSSHIIKIDSSGNFIRFKASGSFPTFRIACLGTDIYVGSGSGIQKLDSALNVIWTVSDPTGSESFDGNGNTRCDLFVQDNGELIASVVEAGNNPLGHVPFGNDTIPFTVGGQNEVGVVKMDTSGNVLWCRVINGWDSPRAVALDHQGNAYLGLTNDGTTVIVFAGDTIQHPGATPHGTILKWDGAGNEIWARGLYPLSGGNGVRLSDMAINAQEEVLVSGLGGYMSFNNDTLVNGSSANSKCFLLKCNSSGTFQWYKSESNIIYDSNSDGIAVRNGNEYIWAGTTNTGSGSHNFGFGCFNYQQNADIKTFITMISEQPECNPLGIGNVINNEYMLSVNPNPATDHLTIYVNCNSPQSTLEVYNLLGKQVMSKTLHAGENGKCHEELDISNLSSGLYVLNVITETGLQQTKKFIKE